MVFIKFMFLIIAKILSGPMLRECSSNFSVVRQKFDKLLKFCNGVHCDAKFLLLLMIAAF